MDVSKYFKFLREDAQGTLKVIPVEQINGGSMIDYNNINAKIIEDIAAVEIPFNIMGSIIKCRYCGAFDAHMPTTLDINQRLKHKKICVWIRSKVANSVWVELTEDESNAIRAGRFPDE